MPSHNKPPRSPKEKNPLSEFDFNYFSKGSINPQKGLATEETWDRGIAEYEQELGFSVQSLEGKRVLNLGSSARLNFEKEISALGIHTEVISVSPEYADETQRKTTLEAATEIRPELVAGIGQALPFASESFDTVLVEHVTDHIGTAQVWRALLTEIERVLRKNGEAYIFPVHEYYFPSVDLRDFAGLTIIKEPGVGTLRIDGGGMKKRVPLERLKIIKR